MGRGKPIRRVSVKRSREQRVYTALRREFLASHPTCKCGRPSEVVQHRQGRGSRYLDVSTWAARCAPCEHAEHMEPALSYASGDLLRRNVKGAA